MELFIENNNRLYYPPVLDGVKWTTERKGSPGVLTFSVYADDALVFEEGNQVSFRYDNENVFHGFVFTKKRSKENVIEVTAYDQLRYLKNKDTYVYKNKKASEVIKALASDFNLNVGHIEDTGYVIPLRDEDNQTLFDMINMALRITNEAKGTLYTLYDNYGELTLKSMQNMTTDLLISDESGEDYEYTSSIDTNTYNRIKLTYDNEKTEKREVFIAQDSPNINKWGMLQYYEAISGNSKKKVEEIRTAAKAQANNLLALYNEKSKSLTFKNLFGDTRARAGTRVYVHVNLGDVLLKNYMLINKATHIYSKDTHFMDLEMLGGGFYGI
jgi:hypothetical protein